MKISVKEITDLIFTQTLIVLKKITISYIVRSFPIVHAKLSSMSLILKAIHRILISKKIIILIKDLIIAKINKMMKKKIQI
jgi:hypothetical protein